MPLVVPAYQAAGAIEIYLTEAYRATDAKRLEVQSTLAASDILEESLDRVGVEARVDLVRRITRRLTNAARGLERHEWALAAGVDFLEKAKAEAEDHRNMIEVPDELVDMVLPYLDDALEGLIDTVFAIGGEQVTAQGLSRAEVRESLPHFAPEVAVPHF